jgi:multidrug efflux pump subunit AcrA (membrane-fusion protein)
VRVPVTAVKDAPDRPSVLVRTASGQFKRRRIELGLTGAQFVEVRSGLRAGERVQIPTSGG